MLGNMDYPDPTDSPEHSICRFFRGRKRLSMTENVDDNLKDHRKY